MSVQWDNSFFDRIDSEGKAWLVGWLAAKGGLSSYNNSSYLTIYIPSKDIASLATIQELLSFEEPVRRDLRPDLSVDHFRLRVRVTGLEKRLGELRIGKGSPGIPFDKVPRKHRRHLVRGWVEAQGCWSRARDKGCLYISTKDTTALEQITEFLRGLGVQSRLTHYGEHIKKLFLSERNDMLRVYRSIYTCDPRFTFSSQRSKAERAILTIRTR